MSQRSGKRPPRLTAKPPHFKPHIPSTAGLPRLADLCAQHRHFQPVTRVRAAELTAEQLRGMIDVHVVEKGVPIVIEDAMAHFGWDAGFDAAWLEQNAGNIPVSLRDNRTQGDADAGSLAEAIKRLRAGKDPRDLLYGKDLNCPAEFTAELDRILPPFLRYMGENDYAHYLPKKLQPMNLMLYAGGDGTFTAGHYDIGGALGHNLMLQADPGAYALWFLFASDHKHIAEDIWKSQNHNSLNLDNYFMPISTLAEQGHRGIPIYVFEQRPGDFMILPGDCAHQVLNVGGFNLKISWNRTTAESLAVSYRETLPRYKASFKPEIYRIESQIFFATRKILESLYQKFAKPLLKAGDPPIDPAPPISQLVSWVSALKQLLPVFTAMVVDQLAEGKGGDRPGRDCLAATPWPETEDDPHSRVCDFCRCDIWNRGWSCGVCSGEKSKDDDDDEDEDEEKAGTSADRRGARMEAKENGDAANGDGAPTPGEASATGLLGVSRAPSLLEEDLDIQAQQTEANGAGALQDGPSDSPALPPIDLSSPCHFDLCNRCFMLGRSCAHPDKMRLKGYVSLSKQRKYIRRFYEVYNAAVRKLKEMRQQGVEGLEAMDSIEEMPNPVDSEDNFVEKRETLTTGTVAYNRFLALKAKVTKMCHSCKAAKLDWLACPECETRYCNVCLWHRYGMRIGECRQLGETWECPRCNDACNCVACMRNRGANFAPFPRPQGIVCLAGWNQHLDEVSGLAVHDVAPPKGPSYNTDGFTVGPPPAEWIAENRGSDEEEEKDERAVRSTNSRRGAPAESSKKAAKASSEPEDEDVLESVADPMDEDQEDKRRRRSNVSSKAKGKQVVRGRAPSAPAPASRNRGNQKRAASSEPESESEPEPERKAKAKPRKSVGSSQQRLTLDDVLRRFRGVVRLLHICLKTNQWIDAFQMVKLLREEVGSHGIAMFDSVDENADAFVRIIPLLLTYADFDETEDVVRGFEKMVRRHFKENPWPWPEMTEAGPPRGGSRAPAAAAKKRKDESEDEDEPESGLSPRKRRKSGTYAERDSDDEEASDGSASEPTGRSRRASTGAPLKREQDRKRARLSAPLPSRSGKKPAPSEKHGLFAPKIESVEGLCNGNTVRAQFYRLPRTEAIFMWNRATGWINWTKVATPLGIKGNVGDLKPADHETLLGSRYVQGRWVTPKAFKELITEDAPELLKWIGPMMERVDQIRGRSR